MTNKCNNTLESRFYSTRHYIPWPTRTPPPRTLLTPNKSTIGDQVPGFLDYQVDTYTWLVTAQLSGFYIYKLHSMAQPSSFSQLSQKVSENTSHKYTVSQMTSIEVKQVLSESDYNAPSLTGSPLATTFTAALSVAGVFLQVSILYLIAQIRPFFKALPSSAIQICLFSSLSLSDDLASCMSLCQQFNGPVDIPIRVVNTNRAGGPWNQNLWLLTSLTPRGPKWGVNVSQHPWLQSKRDSQEPLVGKVGNNMPWCFTHFLVYIAKIHQHQHASSCKYKYLLLQF